MQLQEKHIEFIENSLKLYGVKSKDLKEDLLDHICTYIESQDADDFDSLYQDALQKFGGYASFQNLQLETNFQKYAKVSSVLNKLKTAFGLMMIILLILGMLFKIMHWPYASSMLVASILVFVFGVLPVLFYARYKRSIHKFS